jgi:hypothetical protein
MRKNSIASSRDSQSKLTLNDEDRINHDGGNDARFQSNNQQVSVLLL